MSVDTSLTQQAIAPAVAARSLLGPDEIARKERQLQRLRTRREDLLEQIRQVDGAIAPILETLADHPLPCAQCHSITERRVTARPSAQTVRVECAGCSRLRRWEPSLLPPPAAPLLAGKTASTATTAATATTAGHSPATSAASATSAVASPAPSAAVPIATPKPDADAHADAHADSFCPPVSPKILRLIEAELSPCLIQVVLGLQGRRLLHPKGATELLAAIAEHGNQIYDLVESLEEPRGE